MAPAGTTGLSKLKKTFLAIQISLVVPIGIWFVFLSYNNLKPWGPDGITGKSKFLFCIILTAEHHLQTRTLAVNNTWARHCDKYAFITNIPKEYMANNGIKRNPDGSIETGQYPFPLIYPAAFNNQGYVKLTDKVYGAFKHVYKYYNDYEWYLKADDDTFVFVDNLRYFLSKKNSTDPFNYGFNFPWSYYQSGGAGYVVGNRAMKLLGKALLNQTSNVQCPNTGVEDQDMSNCFTMCSDVRRGGAMDALDRPLFNPWHYKDSAQYLGSKGLSNQTISMHYIKPNQTMHVYYLWMKYKTNKDWFNVTTILDKLVV